MKKVIFFLLSILVSFSCTNQTDKPLSENEKNLVLNEVAKTTNKSIDACNNLDLKSFLGLFMNSADFSAVSSDGDFLNFEQKIKGETEFFNSVTSLHLSKTIETFKVLSKTSVLWTGQFNVNADLKTSEKLTFEKLIVTEIYTKTDDGWKISFFQESGSAPVISK